MNIFTTIDTNSRIFLIMAILSFSFIFFTTTCNAVEPETMLYSDQAVERETAYEAKEKQLRANIETAPDEKQVQGLELQKQLLAKLRDLPDKPANPSIDLHFSQLESLNEVTWEDLEQFLERYINVQHEGKLSASNIETTSEQIRDLYNKLIALDDSSPDQEVLQLQHAFQVRKRANQLEIDKQLRDGINKAKQQFPELLVKTQIEPSIIRSQLKKTAELKEKLQLFEEENAIKIAGIDALIQQQESLLAGYLGHELAPDESKVMHYEQVRLLSHHVDKQIQESMKLERQVELLENQQSALWLQLFAKHVDYFKLTDRLGKLIDNLQDAKNTAQKIHYQVYVQEKELSTLRGGNALIGPKTTEQINKLDNSIKNLLSSLSGFDQRIILLEDKSKILKKSIDLTQSALGSVVTKTREVTDNLFETIVDVLKYPLVSYSGMSISLLLLLEVVLLLVCGIIVNRIYARIIVRMGRKRRWSESTVHLVQAVGKYPFIFIVAMVILSVVGINTSSLALIAGALSVGLGFGMQTIVNNLVSGIILLFDKSIRPGDYISLGTDSSSGGFRGNVAQMNIRATVLRTNDNINIIIPNADLMASQVVNWTYADERIRFRVPFSVAYGSDIDKIKEIISAAIAELPVVLPHPEPQIWLAKHAENGLDFLAAIWVEGQDARQPARTFDLVLTKIYQTLNEHGIEMPVPQMDLNLRKHASRVPQVQNFQKLPN